MQSDTHLMVVAGRWEFLCIGRIQLP